MKTERTKRKMVVPTKAQLRATIARLEGENKILLRKVSFEQDRVSVAVERAEKAEMAQEWGCPTTKALEAVIRDLKAEIYDIRKASNALFDSLHPDNDEEQDTSNSSC